MTTTARDAIRSGRSPFTAAELWDDAGDWQRFFDAHVKPNVPRDLPSPAVVELRNAIVR